MPITHDYSDIGKVLVMVTAAQDAEQYQREKAREAKRFLTVRDGMWDEYAIEKMDGRFRGSFDQCTPIIDGIAGEIEQADFTIRVTPAGGDASKETAETLDGLVRHIRNISNAEDIFNNVGRSNVVCGFDCIEVVQDYVEGDSMDQDLIIERVPSALDSVWFDLSSVEQDRSDANWAVKLAALPIAEYKARWPDGSGMSVGDNSQNYDGSIDDKETVTVGKLYYRKPEPVELVQMTNGAVYRVDEKFEALQDEFLANGITIALDDKGKEKRRTRKTWRVWTRMFDGSIWLDEEEETVFDYIPLIPIYGNFDIIDNNIVYFGKLENLYDAQRVYNYAASRDIEDGALSPSPTIWMTDAMADGNDYSAMNTDRAPIRIFNTDEVNPNLLPTFTGGPQPSVGLQTTMQNMQQMITTSSNTFQSQQGNANAQQSGVAGLQQIEQGNIGNIKWFKDQEVMINQLGKVLINAIPRAYSGTRQVSILSEDGESSFKVLNEPVYDQQTRKNVVLNDLSIGEYNTNCEMGPAFNSAQKEAARSLEVTMSTNPELAPLMLDVLFKNKKEPGMDIIAERLREQAFNNGVIPESQLTDEEQQKLAEQQAIAAQQPPQEDAMMVAARAEQAKAQADMVDAQNKQAQIQMEYQIKQQDQQLSMMKLQLEREQFDRDGNAKYNKDMIAAEQNQQKIDQDQQKIILDTQKQMNDLALKLTEMEQKYQAQLNAEVRANTPQQ